MPAPIWRGYKDVMDWRGNYGGPFKWREWPYEISVFMYPGVFATLTLRSTDHTSIALKVTIYEYTDLICPVYSLHWNGGDFTQGDVIGLGFVLPTNPPTYGLIISYLGLSNGAYHMVGVWDSPISAKNQTPIDIPWVSFGDWYETYMTGSTTNQIGGGGIQFYPVPEWASKTGMPNGALLPSAGFVIRPE